MKFSKKVNYSLFGFLILINIIIRYPFIPHEIGSDSFMIHSYANSISGFGYATWIIHPYSYLGLTPDSYPSAIPFILSAMSQSMNINIEISILLFSFVVGLIGLFGSFLFAKQIKNDDLFIFIVAFLYSTSPIFLRFTVWTTATRHLFMALFPFFLWVLLEIRESPDINWKYIGLSILIFIMLLSTHRLAILLFLIILAFIITIIISRYARRFEFNPVIPKIAPIIWLFILFGLLFLQIMNIGMYKNINITFDYQRGTFARGNNPIVILTNMIVDYVSRTGILSIFLVIGFGLIFLKWKKPKDNVRVKRNFKEIFLVLIILFSSAFILLGEYLTLFVLPVLILLIGIGFVWGINLLKKFKWKIFSRNRQILTLIIVVFSLILSIYFSIFMVDHWAKPISLTNESTYINDESIDTAFYMNNYKNNDIYLSNSGYLERKISAWQKDPIDYHIDLGSISIEKGGIIDLITKDTLYVKGESEEERLIIPGRHCDDKNAINFLNRNNVKYIIEKRSISGEIIQYSYQGLQVSKFLESLHEKRYKIYENSEERIWIV